MRSVFSALLFPVASLAAIALAVATVALLSAKAPPTHGRHGTVGLTEREYQSLSANSPVWQLPEPGSPAAVAEAQPAMTVAQLRERLAHLFGANRTTSN